MFHRLISEAHHLDRVKIESLPPAVKNPPPPRRRQEHTKFGSKGVGQLGRSVVASTVPVLRDAALCSPFSSH